MIHTSTRISMMIFLNKFLFLILLVPFVSCEKLRFDNYTLYKISPENDQHYKLLQDIQNTDPRFDFWSEPTPLLDFVSVMSSPENKADLEEILQGYKMKYEVTMQNIQEAIDKETVGTYTRNNRASMSWNMYHNLESIELWFSDLLTAYPSVTGIIIGGRSYEGRNIKGIKISHGSGRRAIFIEAGIHSREWISPATACYIINELLSSNDPITRAAARDYDWYIFPVTNPDGYVFTHDENRMWRKNRRPTGSAIGVDLNRNWNNNWLVSGASVNPATDTYAGPGPFSEPETLTLSQYIRSIGDKIDLYLSFHSFGQLLLIPFGNSTAPYANYYDAINIGRRTMGALSVRYGTQYVTGNIAEAIYQATGGSVDWVKDQIKVPLVYCYELRDNGNFGFILPPHQILPNNEEVMDSVLEMIHQAERFGYMNSSKGLHGSIFVCFLALIITMFHR
ncbi:zinc carboxypeptidase-like [Vanessa cardui]|uniref:zinc carboxypeptidase-like n=1 Tax=Vanessa cardui TaxID=171605 RepID=UPI001F143887|nr:zinc carboxypeptidase-like [Vanessa cardui]